MRTGGRTHFQNVGFGLLAVAVVACAAQPARRGRPVEKKTNMTNETLRQLPLQNPAGVRSLRLLGRGSARLALLTVSSSGEGILLVAPLDGNSQPSTVLSGLRSPLSSWDAADEPEGAIALASVVPESATVWLAYQNSRKSGTVNLSRQSGLRLVGSSRFARGNSVGFPPITAISTDPPARRFVLFPRDAEGGFGPHKTLEMPAGRVVEARLIGGAQGYFLICRLFNREAINPDSTGGRADANGEPMVPGILYCSRLDSKFNTVEATVPCLGSRLVYEFDADAAGDRVAIIATTDAGYVTAFGVPKQGAFAPETIGEETFAGNITSPAILTGEQGFRFALLKDAGRENAQIFIGSSRER